VTRHHRWVAVLGDKAYNAGPHQTWLSWVRRKLGRSGYWSLAGYAKRKVKTALQFIFDFEHRPCTMPGSAAWTGWSAGTSIGRAIKEIDGLTYANCGDWVDSCTAIVEHFDGRLELVDWDGVSIQAPANVVDGLEDALAPGRAI
jgi:UDP-2,3-diacylglucosamine pyrophosphatase LpxH